MRFNTSLVRDALKKEEERIAAIVQGRDGKEDVYKLRAIMQDALMDGAGIFRNGDDLQKSVNVLQEVYERAQHVGLHSSSLGANPELAVAMRFKGNVRLAMCVAYGALQRTESRGAHTREDFPERNDRDWLTRTLATWQEGESMPKLTYEISSKVWELPPGERGYGVSKIICSEDPVVCGLKTVPEHNE